MKKTYAIILASLFTLGALAQSAMKFEEKSLGKITLHTPVSVPSKNIQPSVNPTPLNIFQVYLDYDSSDAAIWWQAADYKRFIWDMNMHYDSVDNGIGYCVVAFDTMHDPLTGSDYTNSKITSMTIDSIYAVIGHENNSGSDDTLVISIINLTSAGYPGSTVFKDTTLIGNSSFVGSTNNDWLELGYIAWGPAYQSSSMKRFGIRMQYFGDKQDTCGFIAGFGNQGPCNNSSSSAYFTNYPQTRANSYATWTKYNQMLPTSQGGDIYYDCNSNGNYDPGVDGNNYIQNINVIAMITIDYTIGISESADRNLKVMQNYPNPFSGTSTIRYELAKPAHVSLEVYDLAGRKVSVINEGAKDAGIHQVSLNAKSFSKGVYFYTLKADGVSVTNKMTVTE